MKKIKQSILAIVIGLALAAGVSFAAWSNPTANPTDGNTAAPINVGNADQIKTGRLAVQGGLRVGDSNVTSTPGNKFVAAKGADFDGAADFNSTANFDGLTQFNQMATFNAGIKIPTDAGVGKILTSSNSSGNAKWGKMKTVIVESVKEKSCGSYPCTNTWGTFSGAYCDTGSGYVRTGCTTSCAGSFSNASPDLSPTATGEGCNLGANDKCEASSKGSMESPTRIKVKAICVKIE